MNIFIYIWTCSFVFADNISLDKIQSKLSKSNVEILGILEELKTKLITEETYKDHLAKFMEQMCEWKRRENNEYKTAVKLFNHHDRSYIDKLLDGKIKELKWVKCELSEYFPRMVGIPSGVYSEFFEALDSAYLTQEFCCCSIRYINGRSQYIDLELKNNRYIRKRLQEFVGKQIERNENLKKDIATYMCQKSINEAITDNI